MARFEITVKRVLAVEKRTVEFKYSHQAVEMCDNIEKASELFEVVGGGEGQALVATFRELKDPDDLAEAAAVLALRQGK